MSEVKPSEDDATELEKIIRAGKPWMEQNGTLLIYALAAVLAIAAVVVYLGRQPKGEVQASRDIMLAVTPEEYRDVADAYEGTPIGTWARLKQADRLLDSCVTSMFSNREEAINLLEQAKTAYESLVDRPDIEDQVRERVLIGLAKVAEISSDGSDEKSTAAIDAWKRVISQYENSIMKEYAEDRIAKLGTPESKSWQKYFSEQNPKPIDPGMKEGQPAVPELPATMGTTDEVEPESTETESAEKAAANPTEEAASTGEEMPEQQETAEPAKPVEEKAAASEEPVKAPAKEAAKPKADEPKESTEAAKEAVDEAKKAAGDAVKDAKDAATEAVETATDKAAETVKDAAEGAGKEN